MHDDAPCFVAAGAVELGHAGIERHAEVVGHDDGAVEHFAAVPGLGVRGGSGGRTVAVGRPSLLDEDAMPLPDDLRATFHLVSDDPRIQAIKDCGGDAGKTAALVADGREPARQPAQQAGPP